MTPWLVWPSVACCLLWGIHRLGVGVIARGGSWWTVLLLAPLWERTGVTWTQYSTDWRMAPKWGMFTPAKVSGSNPYKDR